MYIDFVTREMATTQEDHNFILAYAGDIAQTAAASEGHIAGIMNVWQAAFYRNHLMFYYWKHNSWLWLLTPDPKY